MLPRTIASFGRVDRRTEAPETTDALITTFLSSLQGAAPGVVAAYRAAARHFLYWTGQQGVAVSAVDDLIVQRFEKHRCRCRPFPLQKPNRPEFAGRVRRFVRFLEDQGAVDVADDVDGLADELADYDLFLKEQQYSVASFNSFRSEAAHFAAWVRLTRQRWVEIGTELVERYAHHDCRCPVYRKRGRLVGRHGPLRRARGAQRFLGFLRDRNVVPDADRPVYEEHRLQAYQAWLKRHCGSTDATILRFGGELSRCLPLLGEPADFDAATIRKAISLRITQTPGSAALVVTIVRSYVRFLISRGECPPALLHAFPPARRYRSGALPRYLDAPTIEKIIVTGRSSCCWLDWACAPEMSASSGSVISTGPEDTSRSAARVGDQTACRSLRMRATRCSPIWDGRARGARKIGCSFARRRRSGRSSRRPRSPASWLGCSIAPVLRVCRPDRICSATPWPRGCSAPAPAWSPSGRSCGIALRRRPPSTPRSTSRC
jgi:hypothetical protein